MTDEDYIDHAINSIIFHHKYDESYKITKAAKEKEEEFFQGSIRFLKNLSVNKSDKNKNAKKILAVPCHYIEEYAALLGKSYWELLDEIKDNIEMSTLETTGE